MTAPGWIAVVGVGGLGCPAARCLADAGVPLRLLDEDRVELGNLHRQLLFTEGDVGARKVEAAAESLARLHPGVRVEAVAEHVAPESALRLLAGAAVVVEGSDNFPTKFLVADACHRLGVPVVHGASVGWIGTVLPVVPRASACYRCVFEDIPGRGDSADAESSATCVTAGVFGPVTAVVGALMAADALRLLRGDHRMAGHVGRYDGWRQTFRATRFDRRRGCGLCGANEGIPDLDAARYALSQELAPAS